MCKSSRIVLLCAVLAFLVPARNAHGQVIFIDPCGTAVAPFAPTQLQVWVCVEGAISGGITAAEFRIDGVPVNWISRVLPTPPAMMSGNPLAGGGLFFLPACSTGSPVPGGRYLQLCTLEVTAPSLVNDVLVYAAAIDPPLPAPFNCPVTYLCDDPVFTKVCCTGFGSWLNPVQYGCGLAVDEATWSGVKNLYQ